jgi:hypothetical protein
MRSPARALPCSRRSSRPHRPPAQVSPCCVAAPLPCDTPSPCDAPSPCDIPSPCATPLPCDAPLPGALPLRALELSGAALCSTKLAGQLADEPAAALRLVRALGGHAPRLVRLSLAGNCLKAAAASAIAEFLLGPSSCLLELGLERNYLGDEGAAALAQALTPQTAAAAAAAEAALRPGSPFTTDAPDDAPASPSSSPSPPPPPPPLHTLRLDENLLTCSSAPALALLLEHSTSLRCLGLASNGLDGPGGLQLVQAPEPPPYQP